MRTLVDIPDNELDRLNAIGEGENRSRASVIREAIAVYLAQHQPAIDAAYGLWGKREHDGLAYQKKARAEW